MSDAASDLRDADFIGYAVRIPGYVPSPNGMAAPPSDSMMRAATVRAAVFLRRDGRTVLTCPTVRLLFSRRRTRPMRVSRRASHRRRPVAHGSRRAGPRGDPDPDPPDSRKRGPK